MTKPTTFLAQWQADYDKAVKLPGTVVDVFGKMGRFGGLAIWVEVEQPDGSTLYYSPYLNSSPGDGEHDDEADECTCEACAFEADSDAWLEGMMGATDWVDWDWGTGEENIPAH